MGTTAWAKRNFRMVGNIKGSKNECW